MAIGPVEVAKRRHTYAIRLTDHGTRYGGTGLSLAIRLLDRLLADLPRDTASRGWASAMNSLSIACETLGERTDGPHGNALLARAVTAYEDALQVFTREGHPLDWATTMQNLAGALRTLGERTVGRAGTALFSRAVTAFEAALQVFTFDSHPLDWATTMQNLAGVLHRQGELAAGRRAGTALIARAVTALEATLQVLTRDDQLLHWATTKQNLAIALAAQGKLTAGKAGTAFLSRSVEACNDALQVTTRPDHPVDWAMTQQNLAVCHFLWSQHPACDDPLAHLRQALGHVANALSVYDPDHMPFYHEKAARLRETILSALARNP